jgi:predicted TIM-barrel fold metal-dependent hydrolase
MINKKNLLIIVIGGLLIILSNACQKKAELAVPETLLLKDFRPQSIYNIPVTLVDKARYPVIDMHAHDYARSIEGLETWVKTMDELGIEKTIILSKEHGKKFDSLFDVYSGYPGRFEVWCGFDYTGYEEPGFGPAAVAELERCYHKGARGVGELGDKGKGLYYCKPPAWGMHSDDPRMDPLFEKCAELGMPVNIHIAEPKWMYEKMDSTNDGLMNAYEWRQDNQEGIVDHQGMIDILERTVQRHPNTTFIACHLANCCYNLSIIGELLDKYPNLYIDIGARFAEFSAIPRTASAFFIKYQDRILYGTDMGRDDDMYKITFRLLETADEHIYDNRFGYHWPLHGLNLPDGVLEKVYRTNALKITPCSSNNVSR